MKNRLGKLITLGLIASAALFVSCGDEEAGPNGYNGGEEVNADLVDYRKPKGNVTLKVDSKANPYGIKGVEVVLVTGDAKEGKTSTDEYGEVVYENLEMGTYVFMISKEGFAPIYQTVELKNESTEAEVPKVGNITANVELLELAVSASGKVVYTDKDGNNHPADTATVELLLIAGPGQKFVEEIITVRTNSLGDYTVDSLIPEFTEAVVYVKSIQVGDQKYKGSTTENIPATFAGEFEYVSPIKMAISAADFMIYSTNLKDIAYNENIKITVSEDIDADEIKYGDIKVSKGTEIMTTNTVSEDLRELTIIPTQGNWGTSGSYTVEIKLYSKDNEMLDETLNFSFEVKGAIGVVSGIKVINSIPGTSLDTNIVDETTTSIDLKWNALANTVGFKVFKKATGDSNFTFVQTASDTVTTLSTTGWFTDGKSVSLVVIGYNTETQSDINSSTVITLNDKLGPVVGAEDFVNAFGADYDNSLGSADVVVASTGVAFTSVVDTSIAITVTSPNPAVTSYSFTWLTDQAGVISASILPGVDASGHSETVTASFAGVKDLYGNVAVASTATLSLELED